MLVFRTGLFLCLFFLALNAQATVPAVTEFFPVDGETAAYKNTNLFIHFDRAVDIQTGNLEILRVSDDALIETIDLAGAAVVGNGEANIVINISALTEATAYYINIDSGAFKDAASADTYAGISDKTTWNFSTTVSCVTPSFTERIISASSNGPYDALTADLDGDGDLDIVTSSKTGGELAWLSNDGSENFTQNLINGSLTYPERISIVDLDQDGDLDILTTESGGGGNISWWVNDGSENFTETLIDSSVTSPSEIHAVDFDGDGDLDIVASDPNTAADFFWWENDGSQNFTKNSDAGSFRGIHSLYPVDIDKDGDYDLVTSESTSDQLDWWENNGSESFTGTLIQTASRLGQIHSVDLDLDGDMDIVGINQDSDELVWWANNGSETFTKTSIASLSTTGNYTLDLGDIDGDGDLDIFSTASTIWDVSWWRNDGSESFTEVSVDSSVAFGGPQRLSFVDMDGDGDLDLLGANLNTGRKVTWWETGGCSDPYISSLSPSDDSTGVDLRTNLVLTFNENIDIQTGNLTILKTSDDSVVETIDLTSGQVTGNGTPIITVDPSSNFSGSTGYYIQIDASAFDDESSNSYTGISDKTTWNFTTESSYTADQLIISLSPTDNATAAYIYTDLVMNFNQGMDLQTGNIYIKKLSDDTTVETIDVNGALLTGNGEATIVIDPSVALEAGTSYYINIDAGAMDTNSGVPFEGISDNGTWNFTTMQYCYRPNFTQNVVNGNYATNSVQAIDLDKDGDMDIVSTDRNNYEVTWWENDGSQNFTEHTIGSGSLDFRNAHDARAVDIDYDGDLDIIAVAQWTDKLFLFTNDGSQNFSQTTIDSALDGAEGLDAVDIDSDGDMDILTTAYFDSEVAIWSNNGSETFTQTNVTTSLTGARYVRAVDLDEDGDIDIVAGAYSGNELSWWANDGSESFTKTVIDASATGLQALKLVDMDGDGDWDIVAGLSNDNDVVWYDNNGSESFTKKTIDANFPGAWGPDAMDIDGDGDIDVVAAGNVNDDMAWWENDGSENFTKFTLDANFLNGGWSQIVDMDGDGYNDVLAGANGDGINWWESASCSSPPGGSGDNSFFWGGL